MVNDMENFFKKIIIFLFLFLISFSYVNASTKGKCAQLDKENGIEYNASISKSDVADWSSKMWNTNNYDAFCTYSYSTTDNTINPGDYFFNICKSGDCHYYYAVGLTKDHKIEYYPISMKGYVGNPTCLTEHYLANTFFSFLKQSKAKKFNKDKLDNKKFVYDNDSCFQISQSDFISGSSYQCPSIAWGTIQQFDAVGGGLRIPAGLDGNRYCGSSLFAYNSAKTQNSSVRQIGKNASVTADIFNKTSNSVSQEDQDSKLEKECLDQGKLFDKNTKKCIMAECSTTIKKEKDCLESNGYKWDSTNACCLIPASKSSNYIECNYQFGVDGNQNVSFYYDKVNKDLKVNNYSTKASDFNSKVIWGGSSSTLDFYIENSSFNNNGLFTNIFKNPEKYFESNGELVCPNFTCKSAKSENLLANFSCASSNQENCYVVTISTSRIKVSDGNLCPLLTKDNNGNVEEVTSSEELKELLKQNDVASGTVKDIDVPDGWKISDEDMTCEELLGSNLTKVVNVGITAIRVVGALITIVFGILTYVPAVTGDNPELLKKANSKAIKMGIILIIILLLPTLVKIIGNIFDFDLSCLM